MPFKKKTDEDDADEPKTPARVAAALADDKEQADEEKPDETIPGGRYLVDGVLKNANGEPIAEDGTVLKGKKK